MSGPILSLKGTALFYLLLLLVCCNFGHGTALPEVPTQQCGGHEGAACPEGLDCVQGPECEQILISTYICR